MHEYVTRSMQKRSVKIIKDTTSEVGVPNFRYLPRSKAAKSTRVAIKHSVRNYADCQNEDELPRFNEVLPKKPLVQSH